MILYYVHDPMCSWCWGFEPCKELLFSKLPGGITVKYLLGGLAEDSEECMPDSMIKMLQQTWENIEHRIPGRRFNFDFWENNIPRRSTYLACRAVISAANQNKELEMIQAVQQAYYQRAINPSDQAVLIELADELGMKIDKFKSDLNGKETNTRLEAEVSQAKSMNVDGFPALVLQKDHLQWKIPVNYTEPEPMIELIVSLIE